VVVLGGDKAKTPLYPELLMNIARIGLSVPIFIIDPYFNIFFPNYMAPSFGPGQTTEFWA